MNAQTMIPAAAAPASASGPSGPPLRVVLATAIYPPDIGGPATHSADLREELVSRGHRVIVLTLWEGRRLQRRGGFVRIPRAWPWPLRLSAVAGWLAANRDRYDVVYATGLAPAAVAGAKLGRRPIVLKIVGDHVWERGARLGLVGQGFDAFQDRRAGDPRLRAMGMIRDWAVHHADTVAVPSRYLETVVRRWVGEAADIRVIPNGVRAPQDGHRAPARRDGLLRALFVGRLVPHKHVDVLIDALAAAPRTELTIVGDGPARPALAARARAAGLGARVRFLGPLAHDRVLEEMAASDVLVTASGYEGLPHVVIEALACGTPVIVPPLEGLEGVIDDAGNGLVVDPPEQDGFARALSELGEDPPLRERLRSTARESGRAWRFERCADQVEALLRRSVERKPRVVLVGKSRLPWPLTPDLVRKYRLIAEHCTPIVVQVGKPGLRAAAKTSFIMLPDVRPRLVGGLLFYAAAPAVCLALTAGRRDAAIVCQSPYEAAGALLLRGALPWRLRPPVVVELHGDWRSATRLYGSRLRRVLAAGADAVAAWAIRRADRVRAVSAHLEGAARRVGFEGLVDRFPTFSDFGLFLDDPPAPLPAHPSVAYVGAIERHKGIDVLSRSWTDVSRRLQSARLVVAGEGSLASTLWADVTTNPRVEMLGSLDRTGVKEVLDRSWCLVLPSRTEGLPRIVLEAMARGRPVVATPVGGIPEVISDGETGVLVPVEDATRLADAIVGLLSDIERTQAMGTRARESVARNDPAEAYARGIARLASWVRERDPRRFPS